MEENYILLKFISSADKSNKKKYLKDFLNGSLYMNTLNYFWNEYYLELAKKRRYAEANGIPFPDKIDMSEHILSEGQADLFEGVVCNLSADKLKMDENFKSALMTDICLRAKGFGYANTLCFYRLMYEEYMQWGLSNYIYQISERMNNFGEYVVVIDKPEELISKIEKAVKRENYKFICGPVKYRKPKLNGKSARDGYSMTVKMDDMINLRDYSSSILNNRTCFDKMDKFSWQNEWRVILYRGEKSVEPYRLEIGNIRDICHWITIDNLENEIKCCLENGVIKNKINGYYGNASKDEVRELFCELGENKAELLAVIG